MDGRPPRKEGWIGVITAVALILIVVLIWQLMRTSGPAVTPQAGQATPGTQPVN